MGKSGSARVKAGGAAYGGAMVDHELRRDFNGSRRAVRDVPPLIWSPYASGEPPEPLDRWSDEEEERLRQIELERIKALIEVADEKRNFTLMDAYGTHVEGARRSAGSHKLFQHAYLQFPTDIEVTPESEREMLAQGVAFINRTYGGNAVFHARLDRDEKGRHGVDVFFAPRYAKTTAKGTEDWISLSKFSKELARERFGQRPKAVKNRKTGEIEPVKDKAGKPVMVWNDSGYFQGRALQDAFFEHLRDSMGLEWAVRGERKKTRDDDWKTPEQIGAEKDFQRAQEEAAEARREAQEVRKARDALLASLEPLRGAVAALEAWEAQRTTGPTEPHYKAAVAFLEGAHEGSLRALALAASSSADVRRVFASHGIQLSADPHGNEATLTKGASGDSRIRDTIGQVQYDDQVFHQLRQVEEVRHALRSEKIRITETGLQKVVERLAVATWQAARAIIEPLAQMFFEKDRTPLAPPSAVKPLLDLPEPVQDEMRRAFRTTPDQPR